MFLLLFAIFVVAFTYLCIIKPLQYWKRLGVPQQNVDELLVQAFSEVFGTETVGESLQKRYNRFPNKRYYGIYQSFMPFILVRDPKLIKQLTVKDFDFFTDHTAFLPADSSDRIWQKSLLNLEANKWRDMRTTLSPTFTKNKLKTIFPFIIECVEQFIKYFEDQKEGVVEIELRKVFAKFTNDVIASSTFGISCNSFKDPNNTFFIMGRELTDTNGILAKIGFFIMFTMPKLAKILGLTFFKPKAVNFFQEILTANIKSRKKQKIVRPNIIQLLLQENPDDEVSDNIKANEPNLIGDNFAKAKKTQLNNEDVMAQAFIFFLAGFETVASLLSFMAYEIAINPDVQERLYQEICDNVEKRGTHLNYEDLMKLKYLDMVTSETLRKYPSALLINRVCTKPYTIQPEKEDEIAHRFKIGDSIFIGTIGLHRDPKLFSNPDCFDPERFNDENKTNIVSGTYLPFGYGPRSCIGNRFALMETKALFYYILLKFEIVVVEKTPIPLRYGQSNMSLVIETGSCVGLKKRI